MLAPATFFVLPAGDCAGVSQNKKLGDLRSITSARLPRSSSLYVGNRSLDIDNSTLGHVNSSRTQGNSSLGYGNITSSSRLLNGTLDAREAAQCVTASPSPLMIPLLASCVVMHGLHVGPLQAWFVLSLKDTGSRYSALGIAYNIGAALLGGTTPLVATSISSSALGVTGAGCYVTLAALVSASTMMFSDRLMPLPGGPDPSLLPYGVAVVRPGLEMVVPARSSEKI